MEDKNRDQVKWKYFRKLITSTGFCEGSMKIGNVPKGTVYVPWGSLSDSG